MPPGASWGIGLAGGLAVLLGTALMFREARAARRREEQGARDTSALARAYAELEAAKSRSEGKTAQLQATLSGMSDGVMMIDASLNLVQWNERFPELTGVPREILRVGLSMEEMIRAQARAGEFGVMQSQTASEGEVHRRMTLVRSSVELGVTERTRPDGRVVELRRSVLPGGGFVTLYTDVTDRKQAEAARREVLRVSESAVAQKAQFVAMVSHEIRVPLNAVVNSLSLLDQSGLSEQQRSLSDIAREAGDTLLDLIDDILDISKMDAGRLSLRPADFDLYRLVEGVRDMFRAPAAERGINVVLDVAPDVPAMVHADDGRVRQILMNFVSNAAKFSRPGQVTILVTRTTLADAPALRFAVCDQGPRIPEIQAAKLFQPFARLDYARDAGAPGTGLGLAICERLTRLMGGQIGLSGAGVECADAECEDPDCKNTAGNAFWVVLPLMEAPSAAPAVPRKVVPLPTRPPRRAAVLLVDDVATNRLLTAAILRREGHRVDLAESGAQAIRMAAAVPYDVIFMDLNMPGMSGCEAAIQIHALDGPAGRVKIVALTGSDWEADVAACRDAGMVGMLAKPVRPPELLETLSRLTDPRSNPSQAGFARAGDAEASTHSDMPADTSLIDVSRLADLQQGLPPGLFASLFEQCLADIRARIPTLRVALEAGDGAAITSHAHALAGMAGSYGLAAVEQRMRGMMRDAGSGDVALAREAAAGIDAEVDASSEMIRAVLRAQAA